MLNDLPKTTTRSAKRVGRGYGSGKGGHTAGRGQKGQKSRENYRRKLGFEGGQLPLYRRLPQLRGWGNKPLTHFYAVSLEKLEKAFKAGETVDPKSLVAKKLIPRAALLQTSRIKILSGGELTKSLKFDKVFFSKTAQEKILPKDK